MWLDNGKNLSTTQYGPWKEGHEAWGVAIHPVIQYLSHVAIRSHIPPRNQQNAQNGIGSNLHQTAEHLHLDFQSTLDPELAEIDPFYAMHGLFTFAAAAESQFLNLLEQKVKAAADPMPGKVGSIGDLKETKDILDEHARRLHNTIEVIQCRGGAHFPRAGDERLSRKAETEAEALKTQYILLLRTTKRLSKLCMGGIDILMSDLAYREAQKGIRQGTAVLKLSLLGFFFIPLSFTTSFFGMNVIEIEHANVSVWLWFVVSIPVLMIAFLYWFVDFSAACKRLSDSWRKLHL